MNSDELRVLFLGDIIGTPGMEQIFTKLPSLIKREHIDLVIANGENAHNGFGITRDDITLMKQSGISVITSGNHIWSHSTANQLLEEYDYLLRPANYPNSAGKGFCILQCKGYSVGVVNIIGRFNMHPLDCPFRSLQRIIQQDLKSCDFIFVDFHAESPAEKRALAFQFDGIASVVVGTHTHVQTADEMILPNGTGYITDLGMCGGLDSIIGMKRDPVIERFLSQMVIPFEPSPENPHLQGLVTAISHSSGQTSTIYRINE